MKKSSSLRILLASSACFLFAGSAFALDGADVANKLNAAFAANGGKIEYSDVQVDGTTVSFKGVKFSGGGDAKDSIAVGDVVMSGVEENDASGYNVETVKFSDVDYADAEKNGATIKAIAIDGLLIPGVAAPGTIDGSILYASAHTGPISIKNKGVEVITANSIESTMGFEEDNSGISSTLKLTGFNADLTHGNDPKAKEFIDGLGIQTVTGDLNVEGYWQVATGKVEVSKMAIDLTKIGRLDVNFSVSGYTTDFIKAMGDAVKASNANADKAAGQQALGMAMMGLMQQLSFESAAVRFDDASITKRVLDFMGKQQNMSGDDMAKGAAAMIPMMMGQLNMPELQAQVTEAANTYLADPKNIEVTAAPEKPVPFPQIMGAAMGAPTTLPTVLGVSITANQ